MKEIIICAACISDDGTIMRGQRHSDCLRALKIRKKEYHYNRKNQGFITSTGRYVDRIEALKIQKQAGVKSVHTDTGYYQGNELFSEDLY